MEKATYKRMLEAIDSYIAIEEYELAFDLINISDISYDDRREYRNKVIPFMQEQHAEWRASSDNLACIVGGVKYFIDGNTIYTKGDGGAVEYLYATSAPEAYICAKCSVYANGQLFFIEQYDYIEGLKFKAKRLDLETGMTMLLGTSNSRGDIVKLRDGSIFLGQNLLDFHEGIYYDPYTHNYYASKDAVSDSELKNAVYKDF